MRFRFGYLAALLVALSSLAMWAARAGQETAKSAEKAKDDAALLRHGEYLVTKVAMCVHCHTPKNDDGKLDKSRLLQGAKITTRPIDEDDVWSDEAPDVTKSGMLGDWGEEGMIKFLSTGLDPDEMEAMPPMPHYRLNAEDARAVTLYLKSLEGAKDEGK